MKRAIVEEAGNDGDQVKLSLPPPAEFKRSRVVNRSRRAIVESTAQSEPASAFKTIQSLASTAIPLNLRFGNNHDRLFPLSL